MITVHDRSETVFTASGLGVLDGRIINPQVSEMIGGQYLLTFIYPADAALAGHLVPENLVAAQAPTSPLRQGFRIHATRTELDGLIHVTALHVTYDLAANLVADTFVVNKTAAAALAQILAAAQYPHAFTATSADSVTRHSARIVRTPVLAAIMDGAADNSFTSRWGGEIARDNWHLHHALRLGADHGVVIRDAKNLTGYQAEIDYSSVATRVLPVGYDGLLLPELYVDSPRITDYEFPMVRVARFPDIKAITDPDRPGEDELPLPQAHAALRQAAQDYLAAGADLPVSSYQVRFVELSQTKEYAHFTQLETVNLGDTVTVVHTDLGARLSARVNGYVYDPLARRYVSVDLGSAAPKFSSVTSTLRRVGSEASEALNTAGVALASADGKTTNHYGPAQPARAVLGDTWFRENGDKTEIWVYTLTDTGEPGWVAVATDLNHAQVSADLDAARQEAAEALAQADLASQAAQQVTDRLDDVNSELAQTKSAAHNAQVQADLAVDAADAVSTYARGIAGELADVKVTANNAQIVANAVDAETVLIRSDLHDAEQATLTAQNRADIAHTLASTASSGVDALTLVVADTSQQLSSQISVLTSDINLRVTKGEVITQINISPETILINGKRIHITGTTTIDAGVIKTAMIFDAAITNAKIANLDAAKITTGYIAAARIQAGSITSAKLTIDAGFINTAMIADAAITDAKIGSLSAAKITTGFLAAARIEAGSITSAKLTIASGFIKTAMIADAAITDAKIGSLSAAKITTGTLNAARIGAGSITATKLASNAIQVGLAGWTSSIRISPTQIAWYNGTSLEGSLTSSGMRFYFGTRYIGEMARRQKKDAPTIQGIVNQLANTGDYVSWTYQTVANGDFYTCLTLDPKGTFYGQSGVHLGADLRTRGYKMYTSGNRYVTLQDCTLTGLGTYPGWVGQGTAKLVFATNNLMFVTGGSYYSLTQMVARMSELITRMNHLIGRFNNGWVTKINDLGGGKISWSSYPNSGLTTMSTTLS